jgi:hypothetical protein
MATLHLAAVVQRPTSFGMTQGNVQNTLYDGDRTVLFPMPMYHYGATGVVAMPTATLNGSAVSLDLDSWDLYDLDTNRPVGGLQFRNSDPGVPDLVRLVERYVREARDLSMDDLQAWVAVLVGAAGGERR